MPQKTGEKQQKQKIPSGIFKSPLEVTDISA
jgi:hypothetical protein